MPFRCYGWWNWLVTRPISSTQALFCKRLAIPPKTFRFINARYFQVSPLILRGQSRDNYSVFCSEWANNVCIVYFLLLKLRNFPLYYGIKNISVNGEWLDLFIWSRVSLPSFASWTMVTLQAAPPIRPHARQNICKHIRLRWLVNHVIITRLESCPWSCFTIAINVYST